MKNLEKKIKKKKKKYKQNFSFSKIYSRYILKQEKKFNTVIMKYNKWYIHKYSIYCIYTVFQYGNILINLKSKIFFLKINRKKQKKNPKEKKNFFLPILQEIYEILIKIYII